jgi:hypothetical protein
MGDLLKTQISFLPNLLNKSFVRNMNFKVDARLSWRSRKVKQLVLTSMKKHHPKSFLSNDMQTTFKSPTHKLVGKADIGVGEARRYVTHNRLWSARQTKILHFGGGACNHNKTNKKAK